MSTYHPIESKADITNLFYGQDEDDKTMSGCISLAYRVVAQQGLKFYKDHRNTLFSDYDIKYGTNVDKDFSYIGKEHFK